MEALLAGQAFQELTGMFKRLQRPAAAGRFVFRAWYTPIQKAGYLIVPPHLS
jgi:hypothetical protein